MMLNDKIIESFLGSVALLSSFGGVIIAQTSIVPIDGLVTIIAQIGGPGLAVWLVYYHTTVTTPNMQKEFREERQRLSEIHTIQLSEKREAFQKQLEKILMEHREELLEHKEEMKQIVSMAYCRYQNQN
jgi:hypothetical protein